MEADFQPRLKRKDFDHVVDDFSDFSFTSPATKIRRLDAELPPMVRVEEEPEVAAVTFDQSQRRRCNESSGVKIEELPDLGENDERAIVLFKPSITTPIVHSPSNFSVSLHPQFISGFKNQILKPTQANSWVLVNEEGNDDDDDSSRSGNGCQAVVPWFPPRFPSGDGQFDCSEMMDAEEMGEASMDVEDCQQPRNTNEVSLSQGLPQWQHCTILQPPHNTAAPTNCMVPVPVILHQSR